MKVNFEIEENYAVKLNGVHIDLHNNFDFIGASEVNSNQSIILEFKKSKGDWVHENEFEYLIFTFKNVCYKYLKNSEMTDFPEDAKCLGEITFFPSDLRDINDGTIPQILPKEEDDIIFSFADGKVIRLNAEYVELVAKK